MLTSAVYGLGEKAMLAKPEKSESSDKDGKPEKGKNAKPEKDEK